MTWLFLWVLGLTTTGLIYPDYQPSVIAISNQVQIQQLYDDEMQRNYQAEQKDIIINDYFLFLKKIWKIRYARGCAGWYEWAGCWTKSFDCAGLIKAYWVAKWILTSDEIGHYNSQTLMSLATSKDVRTAQRWDRTSRQGFGQAATWNLATHFAMISRDYNDDWVLWVYDNANGPNHNMVAERPLKVTYSNGRFYYIGMYRIAVYTNWLVETADQRWIKVTPRVDTDTGTQYTCEQPDPNPLNFSVTIKWFPYDSDANRIATYWYNNSSGDLDLISTFLVEDWAMDVDTWSPTKDSGLCQLHYNATNKQRIVDPRWKDYTFQEQVCLNKWLAVDNKNLRAGYKLRAKMLPRIVLMDK